MLFYGRRAPLSIRGVSLKSPFAFSLAPRMSRMNGAWLAGAASRLPHETVSVC
jgi:hypothetical protein